MSAIAAIGAAAGAVNAGSGLIGSIANAVIAGQKLDVQKQALQAQIALQASEYEYNYTRFNFEKQMSQAYYQLAKKQFETISDLNVNGPARRAQAMVDAGFRTNLFSNGQQLTYPEVNQAMASAATRFYKPVLYTDQ
nr:minor capsid protein [European badger vesivirus]